MYKQYFVIEKKLKKIGSNMTRAEYIESFTEGKKNSLKNLTPREYNEFIQHLNRLINNQPKSDWKNSPSNKMRRKIISLFKKMNYTKPDDKADMEAIENWCIKYGYLHKNLNKYDSQELPKLITQVEQVYKTFIEAL